MQSDDYLKHRHTFLKFRLPNNWSYNFCNPQENLSEFKKFVNNSLALSTDYLSLIHYSQSPFALNRSVTPTLAKAISRAKSHFNLEHVTLTFDQLTTVIVAARH